MDISEIELIQCINDTGGLSQACRELHMSQPTLSKKLARIEQKLNTQLFYRYPKGLVATETARFILSKSQNLRRQMGEIERHVELISELKLGKLNLGVGPIVEQVLLPNVLKEFLATSKGAKLSVVTEDDDQLLDMFNNSELDVIVGPFHAGDWQQHNIQAIPMIKDEIVAVANSNHPVFKMDTLSQAVFANYPVVSPKVQGTTQIPSNSPIKESQIIISDSYDLMKRLILQSDAVCAGPRSVFKDEIKQGLMAEINIPLNMNWESALLIRPETLVTPIGHHVVTLFKRQIT